MSQSNETEKTEEQVKQEVEQHKEFNELIKKTKKIHKPRLKTFSKNQLIEILVVLSVKQTILTEELKAMTKQKSDCPL